MSRTFEQVRTKKCTCEFIYGWIINNNCPNHGHESKWYNTKLKEMN